MVKDAFIKYDESSTVALSSPWGIFFMLSPRYSKKKKKKLWDEHDTLLAHVHEATIMITLWQSGAG